MVRDAKGGLDSLLLSALFAPTTAETALRLERAVYSRWIALRLLFDAPITQQPKVLMGDAVFGLVKLLLKYMSLLLPLGPAENDGDEEAVLICWTNAGLLNWRGWPYSPDRRGAWN